MIFSRETLLENNKKKINQVDKIKLVRRISYSTVLNILQLRRRNQTTGLDFFVELDMHAWTNSADIHHYAFFVENAFLEIWIGINNNVSTSKYSTRLRHQSFKSAGKTLHVPRT
jgi:hypothetical protein